MDGDEPAPARILVADDHPLFRSAVRALLEEHSDSWEVVAEAADGQEALELCRALRPDLVLMDVRMPGMGGLEATRALKAELPRTIVLVVSASEEPGDLAEAVKAGAAGYVLKSATPQRITGAIRRALEGESPLDQEVAMRLLLHLMGEEGGGERSPSNAALERILHGGGRAQEEADLPPPLTEREAEVLRLMARGRTNPQIARNLFVSVGTVKKHVHHIIDKLEVSDRTQAVVRAIEEGLVPKHRS